MSESELEVLWAKAVDDADEDEVEDEDALAELEASALALALAEDAEALDDADALANPTEGIAANMVRAKIKIILFINATVALDKCLSMFIKLRWPD